MPSGISSGSYQHFGGSLGSGSQSGSAVSVQTTSSSPEQTGSGSTSALTETSTEVTAFTIADVESMALTVSVDELDINSVALGQTAQVTLDALEGETFEGEVTGINNVASASGGVAKYSVEVTLTGDERMKAGMNASATIVVEEKEDVVTIPVSALQEQGSQVFVYTELDEDGNPAGEQEVTTGLSDGENVEITEGLSEGDTVYYQSSVPSVSSGEEEASGFDFSKMPDMGDFDMSQMPDMGDFDMSQMPDMGSFGGGMSMPSQEGR